MDSALSLLSYDEYLSTKELTEELVFEHLPQKLKDSSDSIVYISGSIVAGYGDSASDIDLFAIVPDAIFKSLSGNFANERASQQVRRDFGIIYIAIGNVELDLEVYSQSKVNSMISAFAEVNVADFKSVEASFEGLDGFEFSEVRDFFHRMLIAKPISDISVFESLCQSVEKERFSSWLAYRAYIDFVDFGKSFRRNKRRGDPLNAYLALLQRLNAVIDVCLFSNNVTFDRWKWRTFLLKEHLPEVEGLYRRIVLNSDLDLDVLNKLNSEIEVTLAEKGLSYEVV